MRQDIIRFCDGSGISWTICKQSALRSRQVTTPTPHHLIFTGRMLFLMSNQQCQSTEGKGEITEGFPRLTMLVHQDTIYWTKLWPGHVQLMKVGKESTAEGENTMRCCTVITTTSNMFREFCTTPGQAAVTKTANLQHAILSQHFQRQEIGREKEKKRKKKRKRNGWQEGKEC